MLMHLLVYNLCIAGQPHSQIPFGTHIFGSFFCYITEINQVKGLEVNEEAVVLNAITR